MRKIDTDVRPAKYAQGLAQGKTKMQAALDAGYPFSRARMPELRIERLPNVRRALLRLNERCEASAVRTLEELRRTAFFDIRRLFDKDGNLRPITSLSEEEAACIAQFEVIKKNAEAGDGHIDTVYKIKLVDKMKPLGLLAQHFHMVDQTVKVDTDVRVTVTWQAPESAAIEPHDADIIDVASPLSLSDSTE